MAGVSGPVGGGRRANDSTFELNLAPFLDIIVSIIPMLLLSIAFIQIKMIEAPTPQVVSEQNSPPPKPQVSVTLKVSKGSGFVFEVTDKKGKTGATKIPLAGGAYNYDELLAAAIRIKGTYPEVTNLQLAPEESVAFDDLVRVMDTVRQKPRVVQADGTMAPSTESRDIFPDVVFASVGG